MKADLKLDSIYDINTELLKQNGIKGLLFDIDNTLEEYATAKPCAKSIDFIRLLSDCGFKVGIITNARHERAEDFFEGFPKDNYPELFIISKAGKPLKKGFKKIVSDMGIKLNEAAMIGDQIYTDILGGNRSGCFTILVRPINLNIEPAFVRFKRLIEKPFI